MISGNWQKIHECIKRTLMFSSKEKINFRTCFNCDCGNLNENLCEGNVNHSTDYRTSGDDCNTCIFNKRFNTLSEAFHYMKAIVIIDEEKTHEARNLLEILFNKTRKICYLTFSAEDFQRCWDYARRLNTSELKKLVCMIDNFCVENNIK